jgi:hypothetical protein
MEARSTHEIKSKNCKFIRLYQTDATTLLLPSQVRNTVIPQNLCISRVFMAVDSENGFLGLLNTSLDNLVEIPVLFMEVG